MTVNVIKYVDWMITCPMLQLILLVLSGPDCNVPWERSRGMHFCGLTIPTRLVVWRESFDLYTLQSNLSVVAQPQVNLGVHLLSTAGVICSGLTATIVLQDDPGVSWR